MAGRADDWAAAIPDAARGLMAAFWHGPLTRNAFEVPLTPGMADPFTDAP